MTKDEYVKLIVENSLQNPAIGEKITSTDYSPAQCAQAIVSFVEEVERQVAMSIKAERLCGKIK